MNSKIILQPPKAPPRKSSHRLAYSIVICVLLVIVGLVLLVLFYLPGHVTSQQAALRLDDTKNTTASINQDKTTPELINTDKNNITPPTQSQPEDKDQAERDLQVEKASHALQQYLRIKSNPLLDRAQIWAADRWQSLQKMAEQADLALRKEDYRVTTQMYNEASSALESLIKQRPDILVDHLQQAQEDLKANRVTQAIDGFNKVLSMDAEHTQAQDGLARANVREQVLGLITQAESALENNELEAALAHYQNAAKLDNQYPQIEQTVADLDQRIKHIRYDEYISAASEFLRQGALDDAQDSVNQAVSIIANDDRAKTLQNEIDRRKLTNSFNNAMKLAERHRGAENWQGSVDQYHRALALRPGESKAKSALEIAERRLTVHNMLDTIIDDPASLFKKSILNQAEQLMATISALSYSGEVTLEQKVINLKKLISQAKTPLTLSLISDALTEVVIYPAARLGKFQQKNLTLPPGSYVITGTRRGFRDIRKTIDLTPGTPTPVIEIKCSELI